MNHNRCINSPRCWQQQNFVPQNQSTLVVASIKAAERIPALKFGEVAPAQKRGILWGWNCHIASVLLFSLCGSQIVLHYFVIFSVTHDSCQGPKLGV